MFERYTEKARRVVFFARYEASHFGSPTIETEHLLLGWFREEKALAYRLLPGLNYQSTLQHVEAQVKKQASIPTHVDLPLSDECKRVLRAAAEEADRLNHRHIGTEHLLLGLLHEEKSLAAQFLQAHGAALEALRQKIQELPEPQPLRARYSPPSPRSHPGPTQAAIELHGTRRDPVGIREAVRRCRQHPWHWHKQTWAPRDIAIERTTGRLSFDVGLASDAASFILVKGGWTRDHCAVCRWGLFASTDATHGEGYTNGRDWLCTDCYEKFLAGPDYFGSAYSDLT